MLDAIFPDDSPYRAPALFALERASKGRYPTAAWLSTRTGLPKRTCKAIIDQLEAKNLLGTLAPKQEEAEDG